MEPFSAVAQTCSAFARLRARCRTLPGRLHALNNEVTDFEVVCYQVATVVNHRALSPLAGSDGPHSQLHIRQLLEQASSKLNELRILVDRIAPAAERAKVPILAVHAWKKEQDRLLTLQEDIKAVKCTLNVLLGASNSQDMTRIRLHIEDISTTTTKTSQNHTDMKGEFMETLSRNQEGLKETISEVASQVDERINKLEEFLKAQSERFQDSQLTQLAPYYKALRPIH